MLADRGLLGGMKGQELVGYEIHMGHTGSDKNTTAFQVFETPQGTADYRDGTLNAEGTILGTYMHGLFHNSGFRQATLAYLRQRHGLPEKQIGALAGKEQQYDRLAEAVRHSLDIAAIYEMIEKGIDG